MIHNASNFSGTQQGHAGKHFMPPSAQEIEHPPRIFIIERLTQYFPFDHYHRIGA
jgi:hypothetical protein